MSDEEIKRAFTKHLNVDFRGKGEYERYGFIRAGRQIEEKAREEVWESIWKFLNEYNEEDSSAEGQIMFHFVYEKLMDIQESGSDKRGLNRSAGGKSVQEKASERGLKSPAPAKKELKTHD